ncbi:hypothetical protein AWH56_014835 [Anaerobacillus isosaccharinicus]|uniref:Uncharacterized protein n=1 Tax=Anaerobacillus isosaccharinicus TaxID=1532552 RepID=A0A1S2MEK5_9BACI|nr:hypothetical protein [Anaerobacillus isosaccharinicus]MBA5587827.1 hypothetical protein [Anaerobacillus isosaccharinicus]QOY34019.1 hypothetical protein AWH56_014835 [Anaerobacillus isosaccharinicus]
MDYIILTIIGGSILFFFFYFLPLKITILQKVNLVVLAIILSYLFLFLKSQLILWQAIAILLLVLTLATYRFLHNDGPSAMVELSMNVEGEEENFI